jgi:putative transcriptional regulator
MIPYIRRKKNIKQYDMAKALRVSPSYLCKIEKGIQEPSDKFKQACAKYLNVSAPALFPQAIDDAKIRTINRSFSNKLWSVRKEKKIKQYELARHLRCSPSYLSKVEKGLQEPTVQFKKMCAKILKTKEHELFPS